MTDSPKSGIYLIVEFDWPNPVEKEVAQSAYQLHQVVQGQSWIREVVAASGGIGEGPSSIWVFWLENYAALDRLMRDPSDQVCKTYANCFAAMPRVTEKVREEVLFS